MLIGEALGWQEARDGLPFRPSAQAGAMLQRTLKLAGINRPELRLTNIVWCQPPKDHLHGATYEYEAIQHCRQYWEKEISIFRPKVIIAAGEVATRTLTGHTGKKRSVSHVRGYPLESPYGIVVPTYHPSFIMRGNQNLLGVVVLDFLKASAIAKEGFTKREVDYTLSPTIPQAEEFARRVRECPGVLLAFDIETDYSLTEDEFDLHTREPQENQDPEDLPAQDPTAQDLQKIAEGKILSIQFSLSPGTAIFLPWVGRFAEIAREILQMRNPKVGHNAYRFDVPKLREAGISVAPPIMDSMWMFHHLQPDLSGHYNLQSVGSFYGMDVAWKHLATTNPEFYGCVDVDVLQRIMQRLPEEMRRRGVWEGYQRHVVELEPVLDGMSQRGIPVNDDARTALGEELGREKDSIFDKLQRLVPDELKNVSKKEGYVREPVVTTGMVRRNFNVQLAETRTERKGCTCKRGCKRCGKSHFRDVVVKTGRTIDATVERWTRIEPFTPSNKQMVRYIKWKGHPVQIHPKEDRETADTMALRKLERTTHDPLYRLVLDYRQAEKILSTYVEGWKPDSGGRVHPQFLFKPATGQLSSVNPNVQNASAGKTDDENKARLAKKFRKIIEAPQGSKLIELDYKSFHGMTMALEAQDNQYKRLCELDLHSFLTSYMVKEPADFSWPDDKLRDYLKYIKGKYPDVRNERAKRAILGKQFGMGAKTLYRNNEQYFKDIAEADRVLRIVDELFPKVAQFGREIVKRAHQQRYLVSRFGFIRWFWEALKWDAQRGYLIYGAQAEQAIAFLPANDAFGHKKEAMLQLRAEGLDEKFGLINEIHDSLMFCCPDKHVDGCVQRVRAIMEAPSKFLLDPIVAPNGLAVKVDVSVGQNWSEMEEIK